MMTRGSSQKRRPRWSKSSTVLSTLGVGALALGLGILIRPLAAEKAAVAGTRPRVVAQSAVDPLGASIAPDDATPGPLLSPDTQTQTAGGIRVTASNMRQQEGRVMADVCFDMRDNSDWSIWVASLEYPGGRISEFGFTPLELREPESGGSQRVIRFDGWRQTISEEPAQPGARGRRCDTLHFELPSTADISTFVVTIEWLAAAPREGEACTGAYLESVRRALEQRGIGGVRIECKQQEIGGGVVEGLSIVGAPSPRVRQEAEALLSSQAFFLETRGIQGPWQFAGSLSR